jgi:hypothetical protein
MIGSYRWNLFAGGIGLVGTLIISLPNNIWETALIQSLYSFLSLFLLTFIIRWVFGFLIRTSNAGSLKAGAVHHQESDSPRGRTIDLSTPADGEPILPRVEQQQGTGTYAASMDEDSVFTPLNPPKLSTKLEQDPEELVRALRRMTEE